MIDVLLESLDFFNKALEELRQGIQWSPEDQTVADLRTQLTAPYTPPVNRAIPWCWSPANWKNGKIACIAARNWPIDCMYFIAKLTSWPTPAASAKAAPWGD